MLSTILYRYQLQKIAKVIVRVGWNFSRFARNLSAIPTFPCKLVSLCENLHCSYICWSFAKMQTYWKYTNARDSWWFRTIRFVWSLFACFCGEFVVAFAFRGRGTALSSCVVFHTQLPDWFCQRYMLSLKIKPCMSSSSQEKLRTAH